MTNNGCDKGWDKFNSDNLIASSIARATSSTLGYMQKATAA